MSSVLQVTGGTGSGAGGTITVTYASSTTAGSLLIAVATLDSISSSPGALADGDVTDSFGNTWHFAQGAWTISQPGAAIYYCADGTRGASHAVTYNPVNTAAGTYDMNLAILEGSGFAASPFDTTTDATASDATSPWDVTAAAAITGQQLGIYGVSITTSTNTAFTQPSGYTNIYNEPNGVSHSVSCASYKVAETGTPTVGASSAHVTTKVEEVFATFIEAGGDAPVGPQPFLVGPFAWQQQWPQFGYHVDTVVPAAAWMPDNISPKIRRGFGVPRGRHVGPLPAQVAPPPPPAYTNAAAQHRLWPALLRRGRAASPVLLPCPEVTVRVLEHNYDNTDRTVAGGPYTTGTVTPSSNALLSIFLTSYGAVPPDGPVITVTGLSLTWTVESAQSDGGSWTGMATAQCGPSPGSGTLTLTQANDAVGCAWAVTESINCNPDNPIAQLVVGGGPADTTPTTTATIPLADLHSPGGTRNRSVAWFMHRANEATTPRANWIELADDPGSAPARAHELQWRPDLAETTASATWTTSVRWQGIAVEYNAAICAQLIPLAMLRARRRPVALRRGRQVTPVPVQITPTVNPPYATTGILHRLWPTLLRRGRAVSPIPPQFNPPIVLSPQGQGRRLRGWPVRRGRAVTSVPAQAEPPFQVQSYRRRPPLSRRGDRAEPTPAQVTPPSAPPFSSVAAQHRLWPGWLRRSRAVTPVPPQQNPPIVVPVRRPRRDVLLRRRGGTTVVTPPQAVSPARPQDQARARRGWPVRRGRAVSPTPPQVNPPIVVPVRRPRRDALLRRRGGTASVPPTQAAPPPPPYPPRSLRQAGVRWLARNRTRRFLNIFVNTISPTLATRAWGDIGTIIAVDGQLATLLNAEADVVVVLNTAGTVNMLLGAHGEILPLLDVEGEVT